MKVILILAAVMAVAAVVLKLHDTLSRRRAARRGLHENTVSGGPVPAPVHVHDGTCCGLHEVCEKQLPGINADLYYDDEELDRFAGRAGDGYDEDETEQFRQVLMTLRPAEVFAWGRALEQRRVAMPDGVRDEFLMLVSENNEDGDAAVG